MMMPHPLIPVSLPPASVTMAMSQMNHLTTIANLAAAAQVQSTPSRMETSVIKVKSPYFEHSPIAWNVLLFCVEDLCQAVLESIQQHVIKGEDVYELSKPTANNKNYDFSELFNSLFRVYFSSQICFWDNKNCVPVNIVHSDTFIR